MYAKSISKNADNVPSSDPLAGIKTPPGSKTASPHRGGGGGGGRRSRRSEDSSRGSADSDHPFGVPSSAEEEDRFSKSMSSSNFFPRVDGGGGRRSRNHDYSPVRRASSLSPKSRRHKSKADEARRKRDVYKNGGKSSSTVNRSLICFVENPL